MSSGQDAASWSIGKSMAEQPKKTLTLKKPVPGKKGQRKKQGRRQQQNAAGLPSARPCPRQAAFAVLKDIIQNNMVTDAALAQNKLLATLQGRDRAFARLLVTSCLRRFGQIRKIITHCLSKPAEEDVKLVLHLGLTQLLFLDTGAHAATNTTVELAKQLKLERAAGLVNAVMRRGTRETDSLLALGDVLDNLPPGLRTSWTDCYGTEQTAAIAALAMTTPPLDVTLRPEADHDALARALSGTRLQDHTLRCSFDGDIRQMPSYADGLWWVQDAAAALCGTLAGAGPGKIIWDLCAAPGEKTAQLAAAGAKVTAVDADPRRLDRLRANLDRLSLQATVMQADILSAEFNRLAEAARPDVILLDAPCSATGTIRRRPDILVRERGESLAELAAAQYDMLISALRWVRTDGFVIYATCSLQPEEGEHIIESVLNTGTARLDRFSTDELGLFAPALSQQGWARILPTCLSANMPRTSAEAHPAQSGNDGFFIARLRPVAA